MKPQPLIAVRDVEASSAWYRRLLGRQIGHGGRDYEQLVRDGEMLMQLHHWGDHDHPNLGDPGAAPPVTAFCFGLRPMTSRAPSQNARALGARIISEPHVNPNARHREIWIGDLDGYVVVLASRYGDLG
jgi:catechol 2,3-dioxygenase-like lactoylglutathione lyase family enzyme